MSTPMKLQSLQSIRISARSLTSRELANPSSDTPILQPMSSTKGRDGSLNIADQSYRFDPDEHRPMLHSSLLTGHRNDERHSEKMPVASFA
jgi:hypothetical protein